MSKIKMTFTDFVDRITIASTLGIPDDFIVDVENQFNASETVEMNLRYASPASLESFLETMDEATFLFQQDALIWNITLFGKNVTLDQSYVRDAVSTQRPLTALPVGSLLTARFEVPGFTENAYRELTLRYDTEFDPAELLLLEEIGIEVTGNGTSFAITNMTECKLSFYKPAIVLDKYVINYNAVNTILV